MINRSVQFLINLVEVNQEREISRIGILLVLIVGLLPIRAIDSIGAIGLAIGQKA